MKHFKGILTTSLLFICTLTFAQSVKKIVREDRQIWTAFFNQTRFTEKWGTWTDINLRTKDNFVNSWSVGMARLGVTYYFSDKVKLTGGYAYINHFPAQGHTRISQPEHRPWQQLQWHEKYNGLSTMQWIRLEQRFRRKIKNNSELNEGYNFNYKLRYNFMAMIPFKGPKVEPHSFFLALNDEVHINFGREIIYNYFDQNRAFMGIGYQFSSQGNLQFGYLNVFQQTGAGHVFNNIHALRFFVFYNLDFRAPEQ